MKRFRMSRSMTPATLDSDVRSVQFVVATEDPVKVFDWDTFRIVEEVLRLDGMILPESGQVPMLNTHSSHDVGCMLGSFSDFRIEGAACVATAHFSNVPDAETAFTLVREGHLTDVSVGYRVLESVDIPDGATTVVDGKEYAGPLRVTTRWQLFEVSLCPIGADASAKARTLGGYMPKRMDEGAVKDALDAAIASLTAVSALLSPGDGDEQAETEADAKAPAVVTETALEETPAEDRAASEEQPVADKPGNEEPEGSEEERREEDEDAARAERSRIAEIGVICRAHGIPAETEKLFINEGYDMDHVRAAVLDSLTARSGAGFSRVDTGKTEDQKVRSAIADGLLLRCGVSADSIAKRKGNLSAGAENFRGYTMREIARELLRRSGLNDGGNAMDMMGRALTTTDLPVLLTETASRVLLDGWESANRGWEQWCGIGEAVDFRAGKIVGFAADEELKLVPESAEYTKGYAAENAESYQLGTYGRIFPLTRQALINDDIGAFSRIVQAHGNAAARTVNRLALSVLTANGTLSDGVALFHASHNNLISSGGGGTPDAAKLGAAALKMRKQKDAAGNLIQIVPEYFLAPAALEVGAETFFTSTVIGTQAAPMQNNIFAGSRLVRVYDAVLDDSSASTWYLLGRKGMTVNVYFLNGQQSPRLEEQQGWSVDGVEYKVSIDVAAAAVAHQAMVKSVS